MWKDLVKQHDFKFRIWIEEDNTMLYVENIFLDKSIHDLYDFSKLKPKIMRFINKQDKLGKDIYEGDIIKTWRENQFGVVVFQPTISAYGFERVTIDGEIDGWLDREYFVQNPNIQTEIVGNVYEGFQ